MQLVDDPVSEVEHAAGVDTDGLEVTVKPVRAEPPVTPGAVHEMVAEVAEAVAVADPMVGALGVPTLIEFDTADAGPVPTVFLAVMVKV